MPITADPVEDPTPADDVSPAAVAQVRLLISDTTDSPVFSDDEVLVFLALEGDVVKLAAALAFETIAGDEALTSKVIRTQDLSADGAKVAAALTAQAKAWRDQVLAADDGYFELVDMGAPCVPELTEDPYRWPVGWLG